MASLTGRMFSQYHILERIGRGGMATVYRAHDRKAKHDVAIKFISPAVAETDEFLQRFRREVKVVARMDHPHVLPVLDYGEQHGYAYLVMPLMEHGSLSDRLERGSISLQEGGRLLDQVASALSYAHQRGIVHRDVKPSNILIDGDGNALLADFGLARPVEESMNLTGSAVIGTPAYMAPEQIQGGPVDARCDQYALGVLLFQLATGALPFKADTPMGYLLKHVNEEFPSARRRNAKVPETIDRVIRKATAKDPDQRFESVEAMNEALQASLAHVLDPMTNRAPTIEVPSLAVGRMITRRTRMLRIAAAVGGSLLLILVVPVFASGLLGLLEQANTPAEGSQDNLSALQLTAQAGTIEAMTTQLAGEDGTPLSAEQVATAVRETLAAQPVPAVATTPASALALASSSATLQASPSQSVTPTGTPSATARPGSTATSGPSSTSLPGAPSATPSKTVTSSPTPSRTATATGTASPTPTATRTPTLTATPTPSLTSSPSPTENICSLISLGGFNLGAGKVEWTLSSGGSSPVTITRITLSWPAANGNLERVRFDSSSLWHGAAPPSSIVIDSGWTGNRELAGGQAKQLSFEFGNSPVSGSYGVTVTLDGSCSKSGGG